MIEKNHSVNAYKICELEIVLSSSSNDFLDFANTSKIKNQINQVLEIEAPIKKNLLAKRVFAAWNISKLGSRIKAHFEMLLSQMEIKQTDKNEDIVFWNSTLDSENYKGYRVATINGQKRDAEDIPSDEIANRVKEILNNQISLPTKRRSYSGSIKIIWFCTGRHPGGACYEKRDRVGIKRRSFSEKRWKNINQSMILKMILKMSSKL